MHINVVNSTSTRLFFVKLSSIYPKSEAWLRRQMGKHPKGKYTSKNPLTEGQNSLRNSPSRQRTSKNAGKDAKNAFVPDDPFIDDINIPLYIDTPLTNERDFEKIERLSSLNGKEARQIGTGLSEHGDEKTADDNTANPNEEKPDEHPSQNPDIKDDEAHSETKSDDDADLTHESADIADQDGITQNESLPDSGSAEKEFPSSVDPDNEECKDSEPERIASDAVEDRITERPLPADGAHGFEHGIDSPIEVGSKGQENPSKEKKGKKSKGKHVKGKKEGKSRSKPKDEVYTPAFEIKDKKKHDWKKIWKRIGIAAGSFAAVIAIGYFAGVLFFSSHFLPNTYISDMDISFESPEEVQTELDDKIGNYYFTVKGQGMNLKVTSQEAGFNLESTDTTESIMDRQNPWTWPQNIFIHTDETQALTDALSATELSNVLFAEVDKVNSTGRAPVDAYVSFDPEKTIFEIVPEAHGNLLDKEKVLETVILSAMSLEHNIVLTKNEIVLPNVYSDDKRLGQALNDANMLLQTKLDINMEGNPIATIGPETVGPWVEISPEFEVSLNQDSVNACTQDIAKQCNTIGSERTYTRPDGKVVTVKGGTYGWKIDTDALIQALNEAIAAGQSATIDVPVLQSGKGFTSIGSQDWGSRYIDIDLAEQHARLYDDSGAVVWESDIVSGAYNRNDTPQGVFTLNNRARNVTLIGQMKDGKPEYETKVSYWMPFKGNSVGLHDANWQSAFGGSRYKQGFGSHGCVNLPVSKAENLYDLIQVGDVVVVHY